MSESKYCLFFMAVIGLCGMPFGEAAEFADQRQTGIERCELIDPDDYESGMWGNPRGFRTYYQQSVCYQRLAIEFRDLALCNDVRRRYSLFSSGWGYSSRNCRTLVEEKLSKDRAEIRALRSRYLAAPMAMVNLTLERNGNGRDYDFIPRFDDGMAAGYQLVFRLVDTDGARYSVLSWGGHIAGSGSNLRLYLPRQDLLSAFPALAIGQTYQLEATVTLSMGLRKMDGWTPVEVLEDEFPVTERRQTFVTSAAF